MLWTARRLGRQIRWIGDRNEDFVASSHGRDSIAHARLALDRDGRFLALETRVLANLGAYVSTVAPVVPTMAMASAMGGVYDIPLIAFETTGVFTNTTPVDAYRGAGKPEANYLIERLIDIAAAELRTGWRWSRGARSILRLFPPSQRHGALSVEQGSFARRRSITPSRQRPEFHARRQGARARGVPARASATPRFLETARGQPNQAAESALRAHDGPHRSEGRHALQRPGPRRPPTPRSRRTRSWLADRALPVPTGRTPTISTAAAGMAARRSVHSGRHRIASRRPKA